MGLAFRLYGNFRWPPTPASVSATEVSGVADIFFLPERKKLRAALRWTPGKAIPPAAPPDTVADVDPAEAIDYLGEGKDKKAFWIDTPANGDWLALRGAFLIEQYTAYGMDLRLPLANAFAYYKTFNVFSGLRLLKGGSSRYGSICRCQSNNRSSRERRPFR